MLLKPLLTLCLIIIITSLSGCGSAPEPTSTPLPPTDTPTEPLPSESADNTENSETETTAVSASEANTTIEFTSTGVKDVSPQDRLDYYKAKPEMVIDPSHSYRAIIKTSKGDIVVSLDAANAPEHVNNFVYLSLDGFYDGLTFHRVEPSFVIQGGDPLGTGNGGPGYTVPGEFSLPHVKGALAMARLPDQVNPDRESSGSQFYITLEATPFLDSQYSAFGVVEAGMDVVNSIEIGDIIETIVIE